MNAFFLSEYRGKINIETKKFTAQSFQFYLTRYDHTERVGLVGVSLGLRGLTAGVVVDHGVFGLIHSHTTALQTLLTGAVTLVQLVVKDVVGHKRKAGLVLKKKESEVKLWFISWKKYLNNLTWSRFLSNFMSWVINGRQISFWNKNREWRKTLVHIMKKLFEQLNIVTIFVEFYSFFFIFL